MIEIVKVRKSREKVITKSGTNIPVSIDGEENFDMLAGWCKVFHQSTDHFIIGRFMIPTRESIAAYLSPLDLFSNAWDSVIIPMYKKRRTSSEVSLASQTHHVPHVGFPHIDPVTNVAIVKQAPRGANALIVISAKVCLKTSEKKAQIAILL